MAKAAFSSYEKIPDSLKKFALTEKEFSEADKLKWVVTEKVHGANFSFIYENKVLKFAKRKEYLSWKDDFFGFQIAVKKLENSIFKLFEELSFKIKANKFIIYGELFGGEYPHPDVNPDKDLSAIQTGVYYTPSIEFYAFDIAIEPETADSKYYLDYETALSYFERFNIFHAKALFTGKLSKALNFDTRINSTIPKELKLPELQSNLIEGIVVKPIDCTYPDKIHLRPIIKIKNPEFGEESKFHKAKKWNYIPNITSKSEELDFLVEELRHYITKNRLNSAISKIGPLDLMKPERIKKIEEEFLNDVLNSFIDDNNFLEEIKPDDEIWIKDRIYSDIRELISSFKPS